MVVVFFRSLRLLFGETGFSENDFPSPNSCFSLDVARILKA